MNTSNVLALLAGSLMSACGMTDSRLDVLPPTPLITQPPPAQTVNVGAVSLRMIELSGGTNTPSVATDSMKKGLTGSDEKLAQALVSTLERAGLTLAMRESAAKQPPIQSSLQAGKNSGEQSWEQVAQDSDSEARLPPVQNVSDSGVSNFSQYLQKHEPVNSRLIPFASDSMTVSAAERRYLRRLARQFKRNTDIISVLGCSNGPTRLRNGNALLALGRAQGVQQQLLVSGVPPDLILTEGCWSGKRRTDGLPNRGVIVTLFRQAASDT